MDANIFPVVSFFILKLYNRAICLQYPNLGSVLFLSSVHCIKNMENMEQPKACCN